MKVRIEQKPTFKRAYKKLHRNQKKQTNQAINDIIKNEIKYNLNSLYITIFLNNENVIVC